VEKPVGQVFPPARPPAGSRRHSDYSAIAATGTRAVLEPAINANTHRAGEHRHDLGRGERTERRGATRSSRSPRRKEIDGIGSACAVLSARRHIASENQHACERERRQRQGHESGKDAPPIAARARREERRGEPRSCRAALPSVGSASWTTRPREAEIVTIDSAVLKVDVRAPM